RHARAGLPRGRRRRRRGPRARGGRAHRSARRVDRRPARARARSGAMNAASLPLEEQALVELAQWIGRAPQDSPSHPLSMQVGQKTHRTLASALANHPTLHIGVLKDNVVWSEVPATHPILRTRLAPYLHERGVLVLRFAYGVSFEELYVLVELLARTPVDL